MPQTSKSSPIVECRHHWKKLAAIWQEPIHRCDEIERSTEQAAGAIAYLDWRRFLRWLANIHPTY